MDFVQGILTWMFWYFRPVIKGFLRLTTRLCELQRICYGEKPGGMRSCAVGKARESYSQHLKKSTFIHSF